MPRTLVKHFVLIYRQRMAHWRHLQDTATLSRVPAVISQGRIVEIRIRDGVSDRVVMRGPAL